MSQMVPVYVCLWCGYVFAARREKVGRIRQCPRCNHVDLILTKEIEEMAAFAKKEMESTLLGAIPFIDTMKAIFWKKGLLRYRARSTLNLEFILYKMAVEGKTLEQALEEVFKE